MFVQSEEFVKAHGGCGGIHHPDEDRVFTTDELRRLMGLPDDF